MEQRQARITSSKKDTYKNFYIEVDGCNGINQVVSPNLIADTDAQEIWNFLPLAENCIRKVEPPRLRITMPDGVYPVKLMTATIGSQYYMFIFCNNGSVYKTTDVVNITEIAPAGTLSGNPATISAANWQSSALYVIDGNGYFKYNGTTWSQVSSQVTGSFLTVWQGRMFYVRGHAINYSVALNAEDFSGTGSGYIDIRAAFPSLKYNVTSIVSYIDSLIIYGDSATFMLTGSTISNDPSQWYLTEVDNSIGVRDNNSVVSYEKKHYFHNEKGLYLATASQSQKFDYKVDLTRVNIVNRQSCVTNINNLVFYMIPVSGFVSYDAQSRVFILAFCVDLNQFYFLDFGESVSGCYRSSIVGDDNFYIYTETGKIYSWGGGSNPVKARITTKQFDLGNMYTYKFWWTLFPTIRIISGTSNLTAKAITEKRSSETKPIAMTQDVFCFTSDADTVPQVYAFTEGTNIYKFVANEAAYSNGIMDISSWGVYCYIIFDDNSSAIFDIINYTIKGQISYGVM